MYELTCPFCKATTTSSFVRVGAVAICRKCHHQFSVKPENVQQVARPPAPAGSAGEPVAVPEQIPGDEAAFPQMPTAAVNAMAQAELPAGLLPPIFPSGPAAGAAVIAASAAASLPPSVSTAPSPGPASRPGSALPRYAHWDINPLTWLIAGAILAAAAWGTWLVVQHTRSPMAPRPSATAPATQVSDAGSGRVPPETWAAS